jgi:hypothetical protein
MKTCQRCGRPEDGYQSHYRDRVRVDDVSIIVNGSIAATRLRLCTPCWLTFQEVTGHFSHGASETERSPLHPGQPHALEAVTGAWAD